MILVSIVCVRAWYSAFLRDIPMLFASGTSPYYTQEGSNVAEKCQEQVIPVKLEKKIHNLDSGLIEITQERFAAHECERESD